MSKPTKWEYGIVSATSAMGIAEMLPTEGEDGWELVSVIRDGQGGFVGYMKRPLPPLPADR